MRARRTWDQGKESLRAIWALDWPLVFRVVSATHSSGLSLTGMAAASL
jgi:hypothetical protein